MKGTLLLLALLMTGELGFQTTEACTIFFQTFATMVFGNKGLMNSLLSNFDHTAKEREAFEKVQECYNEKGLTAKFLDINVLHEITVRPPCSEYYTKDTTKKFTRLLSRLTSM